MMATKYLSDARVVAVWTHRRPDSAANVDMVRRGVPARASAVIVAAALCTACGAGAPSTARRTTASPGVAAGPSTTPNAADRPLTLAFAGDVHFAGQLGGLLSDPATGLAELRPVLGAADLTMVNLETAITDRGVEQPKTYHFRTSPSALTALAAAGVDAVTMANNHAADYGPVGLTDTLAAGSASPIPVVGLGADEAAAYAPAVRTVRGRRVALLAGTQISDWTSSHFAARGNTPGVATALDPTRLAAAVRAARTVADVVVVYLHWGTDYTGCPNPLQERTARVLADAGADVVVGAHAHQVQAGGWLGPTYVAYGLGNFVWYGRNSRVQAATGVLTLTLDGRRVVREQWTPLEVSADGIPRASSRGPAALAAREQARGCSDLTSAPPAGAG